jgi:hypothetical protein
MPTACAATALTIMVTITLLGTCAFGVTHDHAMLFSAACVPLRRVTA